MVLKNIKKKGLNNLNTVEKKEEKSVEHYEAYTRSDYREYVHGVHDTMRGLFFIIKGTHAWKKEPTYINRVTGEVGHLGGYNPNSEETATWYMVMDRVCYHTIYCGSDLEKAITAIRRVIIRHRGVAKSYFRDISKYSSDDYYEVHYLGHPELTPEKRAKKCEGRCPRTSPIMADMYRRIDMMWGDFLSDEVQKMEDETYQELEDSKPVNRSKKIMQNSKRKIELQNTARTTAGQIQQPNLIRKKPLKLRKV